MLLEHAGVINLWKVHGSKQIWSILNLITEQMMMSLLYKTKDSSGTSKIKTRVLLHLNDDLVKKYTS